MSIFNLPLRVREGNSLDDIHYENDSPLSALDPRTKEILDEADEDVPFTESGENIEIDED